MLSMALEFRSREFALEAIKLCIGAKLTDPTLDTALDGLMKESRELEVLTYSSKPSDKYSIAEHLQEVLDGAGNFRRNPNPDIDCYLIIRSNEGIVGLPFAVAEWAHSNGFEIEVLFETSNAKG